MLQLRLLKILRMLLLMLVLLMLLVEALSGIYETEHVAFAKADDVVVLQHRRLEDAAMIRDKSLRFRGTRSQSHDPICIIQ